MKPTESKAEESKSWDVARSPCHNTPIVYTPVFLWRGEGSFYRFGKSWICMAQLGESEKSRSGRTNCWLPSPRYPGDKSTLFCDVDTPKGFSQSTWELLKRSGPGYLDAWGYWLDDVDGFLKPHNFPGAKPFDMGIEQKTFFPSHGLARKDAMGGDAYQKDYIEDVPF